MLANEELTDLRQKLADPNLNGSEATESLRKVFVEHPARKSVQPFFQRLLDDTDNEYPEAASWFATDRVGNQVAAVFEGGTSDTIGKNYSFRTYFTGQAGDIKDAEGERKYPVEADPESRPIIENPHLSASFLSQASGLRKVAFSTPIRSEDNEVIGIVAVTVNLGKLVDFDDSFYHYVVLVDDRKDADGNNGGIILEHPLFLNARRQNPEQKLPEELTSLHIDIAELTRNKISTDPLGDTEIGKSFDYDRDFFVATVEVSKDPVQLIDGESQQSVTGRSGIYVVAFEDYDSVLKPSRNLSARLGRLAILALVILLSVAIAMWLLVTRLFRESRRRIIGTPENSTLGTFGSSTAMSESGTTARASDNTKVVKDSS